MSNLCVVANPEGGVEVKEEGAHEVTVFFLESSKKVLWIEANEKFVDILLNFLLLPVGVAVQAVSRQAHAIEGRLNPIGGLGNIFANFQSPGMDGKVSTSEVIAKLLNPPPVLCNPTQLKNAYACAYMSEPNLLCSRKLHEMAKWHTYIVTEALEVHPSSVAKGMDLLRDVQYPPTSLRS